MKYYAVTDDPRELYHYGVKGMKWGQHIFGDKSKSPGYKRAASKLRGFAKKAQASSRKHEEHKYEKAVQKAQRRMSIIENLNAVDNDKQIYDQINKSQRALNKRYKQSVKNQKAVDRLDRKYEKNEAKMDKYVQQARQGKLKYGRLSDEQVQRVQERLMLESQARKLGSAEKTWRQQKKEARRAGYLSGITKGTAAAMEEVARAGATWGVQHALDRQKLRSSAKQEGKENRAKNRAQNKKTHRDINNEIKQEAYEARAREGENVFRRAIPKTTAMQAKHLKDIESNHRKLEYDRKKLEATNEVFNKQYLNEYGFKDEDSAISAHVNLLEAKKMTARNKYGKDSEQYREAKNAVSNFNNLNSEQQKRAMLTYDAKEHNNEEEQTRKENEEYKIKLEEYKADRQKYQAKMEQYNKIERDYVTDFNKWLASGAKGKPPIKPYFPKPDEPEPPKMPKHLLSGNSQGGGGKKK